MKITSVILAAGQGTRMRSTLPKVLHPILGKPLIWYAIRAAYQATKEPPVVVVGHQADRVRDDVDQDAHFVTQAERLGTGHAVQQAENILRGKSDLILVTYADMPLISPETLENLIDAHRDHDGPISVLTLIAEDARGFGRIIRGAQDDVLAIVEEAQATPEQKAIRELNTGVMCFNADWLWDALPRVELSPKGEYYLTDLVAIAVEDNKKVQG
ncbi:MAG: NTP transferase domain-containing protein, partial [Chloroflexota bacterium]